MQINRANYSVIALCIAVFFNGILIFADAAGEEPIIPILMLLLISELGLIISLAGVYYGAKQLTNDGVNIKTIAVIVACASLGLMLGYKGYVLWQSLGLST